jgi:hypothetical protein
LKLNLLCIEEGCKWEGTVEEYKAHYETHFGPKKCTYCNLTFENQAKLNHHIDLKEGNCMKQPIKCLYHKIGCNEEIYLDNKSEDERMEIDIKKDSKRTILTRENINEYLKENVEYHLKLLFTFMDTKMDNFLRETQIEIANLKADKNFLLESYNPVEKLPNVEASQALDEIKMETSLKGYSKDNQVIQNFDQGPSLNIKKDTINLKHFGKDLSSFELDLQARLSSFETKFELIEKNQKNLINDLIRAINSLDKLKLENKTIKETVKEYQNQLKDLTRTLSLTQVSLLTLEERLINQEKVSYNGVLLWKITNVQERMQEAKVGRQTSFYSPPFYTDRNGFKMCARIYLNGDGNGRNTHLSLFFVILRGENDALLKWPFRQKVTFILIDQSNSESRENVFDAFRPDPNSSSFRRPVSDMNIASGLPVFCPLGKLLSTDYEYIKDNTMFIKIIVDTKDLAEL